MEKVQEYSPQYHSVYPTYEIETRDELKLIDEVKKILEICKDNKVVKIRITLNRL